MTPASDKSIAAITEFEILGEFHGRSCCRPIRRRRLRLHACCSPLSYRVRRQSRRSEVDRFGDGRAAASEHHHRYDPDWIVCSPAQRDGATRLQALVDASRAALGRTQYLRAIYQPCLLLLYWQWQPIPAL